MLAVESAVQCDPLGREPLKAIGSTTTQQASESGTQQRSHGSSSSYEALNASPTRCVTARALAMKNIDTDHGPGARRDPMCFMLRHIFGSVRRAMQIELAKTVAAQPATAFSILANVVGWPEIISSIRSIEVLTPGPIQTGSRLREDRIMFGAEVTLEVEIATIECPHRLRLLVDHPDLHYELDHLVDAVYGVSCRMMLIFRSSPATAAGRG